MPKEELNAGHGELSVLPLYQEPFLHFLAQNYCHWLQSLVLVSESAAWQMTGPTRCDEDHRVAVLVAPLFGTVPSSLGYFKR
jgi:hypothetical protein